MQKSYVLACTKMHGIGNDYVYIYDPELKIKHPNYLASWVSDRHFAVGSDGLVLILPSESANFQMRMFNADGSEAEMCGNAIRCVAKYVCDRGLCQDNPITIETKSGIKTLALTVANGQVVSISVDMGSPELIPAKIPALLPTNYQEQECFLNLPVESLGQTWNFTAVSMGNPHIVHFLKKPEDLDKLDLPTIGPALENHPLFPKRINVEFVAVHSDTSLSMRVWERGAGETLACGTGACAVGVAAVLNNKTKRAPINVKLRGGSLTIDWRKDNHVYMIGSATTVFDAQLFLPQDLAEKILY